MYDENLTLLDIQHVHTMQLNDRNQKKKKLRSDIPGPEGLRICIPGPGYTPGPVSVVCWLVKASVKMNPSS